MLESDVSKVKHKGSRTKQTKECGKRRMSKDRAWRETRKCFSTRTISSGNLAFHAALKPISPREPFPDVNQSAAVSQKFCIISQTAHKQPRTNYKDGVPALEVPNFTKTDRSEIFYRSDLPPYFQDNYPQLEALITSHATV